MVTAREQESSVLAQGGEALLEQAQNLVPQIVSASASVKSFLVRWKMIISRLERLPGLLAELGSAPLFSKSALCVELLESLAGCLLEILALVSQCALSSYGGGKLQMQSRLDSLANKLDGYLHDSRMMIDSGVLCQGSPLMTVSAMGVTKESRKWTVKDLLARLQMGSSDSRIKALDSLVEFMEDDKNVLVVAAAQGSIAALVHLLDARVPAMREKAAAAVSSLANVESCVHQIVSERALQSLVRLLDPARGSLASERSARALQHLTVSRQCAIRGGSRRREFAARLVPGRNSGRAGRRGERSQEPLLRGGSPQEYLRGGRRAPGAHLLAKFWDAAVAGTRRGDAPELGSHERRQLAKPLARCPAAQEAGIGVLRSIAASEATVPSLVKAAFLHQLAGFVTHGSLAIQQCAAAALGAMAVSSESQRAIGEAGCITPLVRMLDAKTSAAQEHAVSAVAKLLELESNRRIFVGDEKGISGLVRLLESTPGSHSVAAERAVAALMILAGNSKNKKQIGGCGACYSLRRLVELEVPGAKKLLEKLEGGKLRSLLKKLDISSD